MKEGKIIIKDFITGEPKEAIVIKDDSFWGGYKVEYENNILSINIVQINLVD